VADLPTLFHELIRFETELWDEVDAELRRRHDLPLSKFEPLKVIAGTPSCRVHDVAGALALTSGGTSKLIDSLESAGLCKRAPNPDDRRSSIIELTPLGRRTLTRAEKTFDRTLADLFAAVPARTLDVFTTSTIRLRAAIAPARDSRREGLS
jgi:MarR family transcriptional regulator, organic hydroperoxide resistance regulator